MTDATTGPAQVFWHADPSLGDPDDDYTAAVLKALGDEAAVELVGALVNRRPAFDRAEQLAVTLAALGVGRRGGPVPVGVGADNIGRAMGAVAAGAPYALAPAPVDGRQLQLEALQHAEDGSLVLLVTTALTDLDWLLGKHHELARRKLRAVIAMSDARRADDTITEPDAVWAPGDATNNTVDLAAASRVFARVQAPAWRHVRVTVLSRWAVFDGGQVPPAFLNELAGASPVAAWLRDRTADSINERWTSFNRGLVAGRDRASFVANHIDGRDPGRGAEEGVFDLVSVVPIYDAVAAIGAIEPRWFDPAIDDRSPNFEVIGLDRPHSGVRDPNGLNTRLRELLQRGFGA